MTAPAALEAPSRPVRVTIEGMLRGVRDGVLRLDTFGSPLQRTSFLIPEGIPGVSVEDITPPRDWRDGDVVQDSVDHETAVRREGTWDSTLGREFQDDEMSHRVADRGWTVLRYQAGEAQ